ncbi:MAG: Uma2 family endonuclease [Synechocystis sp.]|jgi:Uma2 family endonuclease
MMKTLVRWTVDDYHEMIRANILANRKCELINGEIVAVSPELPQHYSTVKRGTSYLTNLLQDKADVRFNGPVTLGNSEPEPDIAIVKLPDTQYSLHHPYPEDIYWLIEVANTSFDYDVSTKKKIYAEAKIPEYWVVNLNKAELMVFREPMDNDYSSKIVWNSNIINPLAFPDVGVVVKNLFIDN